eukprot:6213427-Pleurochrysis_carterae.AAC.5
MRRVNLPAARGGLSPPAAGQHAAGDPPGAVRALPPLASCYSQVSPASPAPPPTTWARGRPQIAAFATLTRHTCAHYSGPAQI